MANYVKPYRLKKRKTIFNSKIFWLFLLVLLFLGSISYFLFFSSFFKIKNIQISGNEEVLAGDIENITREKIIYEYGDNIFLFGSQKMEKTLLEDFPKIFQAKIKKDLPDSLRVEVRERKPVAVFKQNGKFFCLDEKGVAFEELSTTGDYLLVENPAVSSQVLLGQSIIKEDVLSQILDIKNRLENDLNVASEGFIIVSDQRLNVKTIEGWEIFLNPRGDIDWQITELDIVLKNKIPPEKRRNLEYIDLRFQKIYVFPDDYNN